MEQTKKAYLSPAAEFCRMAEDVIMASNIEDGETVGDFGYGWYFEEWTQR